MGKLPTKYILLDEGLQDLSLYRSVAVLVYESGCQYRICLSPGCHYSVAKCACEECKSWLQSGWSHFGVPCILPDSLLHLFAELRGLAVHLHFQANSPQ